MNSANVLIANIKKEIDLTNMTLSQCAKCLICGFKIF